MNIQFKVTLGRKLVGYERPIDRWYHSTDGIEWAAGVFDNPTHALDRWASTGKHDSNGAIIFDGDIVEYFGIKKLVGWNNDTAQWCLKRSVDTAAKYTEQLATVNLNKTTILGSLFANPELLDDRLSTNS